MRLCERSFSLEIQHEGCFCFTTKYRNRRDTYVVTWCLFLSEVHMLFHTLMLISLKVKDFFSINHARAGKNVGYISSLSGLSAW